MRNSWKLGVCAALLTSVAFMGCSDDSGDDDGDGGSAGGGTAGRAGSAGSAGKPIGGSSSGSGGTAAGKSGSGAGGTAGTAGGSAGSAGTAGSAGSAGTAGSAGSAGTAGTGGSAGTGGTDAGGAPGDGGMGGTSGGEGGASGNPENCIDTSLGGAENDSGGAGGAPAYDTAVILIDDIQVKDGATLKHQWQFADEAIVSVAVPPDNPGDRWSRYYGPLNATSSIGLGCDGEPAAGSLYNMIPFSDANQYHELGVPFAQEDYTGYTISAKVKLVSGGKDDAACPARVALYIGGGQIAGNVVIGPGVALEQGEWVDVTMTVAEATGTDKVDRLGFNLNTYACQ
jgi:hypothetical protein